MELWDVLDEHGNPTGRTVVRGQPMAQNEYHLVVHVWVMNSRGEFLISKRSPNKPHPNLWEPSGGSAIAGEDSLTAAIREVREEVGIVLDPRNGRLFRRYRRQYHDCPDFLDVWLFRQEVSLADAVCREDETSAVMLATKSRIKSMIDDGSFIGLELLPYIDDLFNASGHGTKKDGP